jgi:hypothetical protein
MPKLYSVAEANALLPEITDLLRALQQQVAALAEIETELKEHRKLIQSNGHGAETDGLGAQAHKLQERVRTGLERLHDLDIELKDLQMGLIDFYHEREGRLGYLCWRLGEPEVLFWHDLDTGFAGRQLLT